MTMKRIHPLLAFILLIAWVVTGCQSPKPKPSGGGGAAQATRDNCYSLLHQLLSDEKDVSLLRFIKREQSDVKILVKKIATASGTGAKQLEEFARQDPSLDLADTRLPPGEAATREAIAATKQKELLGQSGDEFELSLLLSQSEALSYAAHLAKVAGENELQPDRARALADLNGKLTNLNQEVFALLLSKTRTSGTNQVKNHK
ncbi:MAG: hypothetical protein JWR69_4757 [Pedosphaera sp.]|nr:hypothetical protein [Pedosphaera sp.]